MQLPLRLKLHDGRAIYIQPSHVAYIIPDQMKGLCKITFVGNMTLQVMGDSEDIADLVWPLPDGR